MEEEITIDIAEIIRILKAHFIWIVLVGVFGAGIGFAVPKFLLTPEYKADVSMIVKNSDNAGTGTVTTGDLNASEYLAGTYAYIIKSDIVLQQVIDELHLNVSYRELSGQIVVDTISNTQILNVSMQHENPELAELIIDKISRIAPEIIVDRVEAGSCKIVSNVRVTDSPVYPSVKKGIAIGCAIGIMLAVMVILCREFLDNTVKTEDQLTSRTGLTVIGVIPKLEKRR